MLVHILESSAPRITALDMVEVHARRLIRSVRSVIYKLLSFTLAMIAGPIGVYFVTLNTIYKGQLITASRPVSGMLIADKEWQAMPHTPERRRR